ncbi:DEAD/DEAH box helicase [Sandaracinus amylolyticus]|uniref:DEAD/DEAH box helicase n=1 Tax=Sandaracinus amylolyticus TaxID=927083 RepID=UPI001F475677|nr:DEAD/DEAH box helicase [Sandaracinus amylolyticus]UJR83313.1 Hypothetical protein I5071_53810 [Sandaracinus amylolyticus]
MTNEAGLPDVLEPALRGALERKGYTNLTPVQLAVLQPSAAGRDLRISSQTGSGKTVAIGLVLRELVLASDAPAPRALVIAPTRELARQVERELTWLYAQVGARVVSVTGGSSYRDEHRALSSRPEVVVGTPGRLLDHAERGALDLSSLGAVVLDEADRMLDLGFREALESILARTPATRRTHLVSATFADEVGGLADRVQKNALRVEGTRLGAANADIDHIVHLVSQDERFDAVVNLLLAQPDARTLVFARTRADVACIAEDLAEAGFPVAPLSGEMDQRERNRALAAFRRGNVRVLVATDVAARGLDVQEVTLVVHVEAPTDPDDYTHRSGRTGRAGRKGTSALLVTPRELPRARSVMHRAAVRFRFEPLPTANAIRGQQDERLVAQLTAADDDIAIDPRAIELARRLVAEGDVERAIARLVAESAILRGPAPRDVRPIAPPTPGSRDRMGDRPRREAPRAPRDLDRNWAHFHVTWGARHGADPRRVLAMVCRRGRIASDEVGGIRVGPFSSEVQVAGEVAERFAEAVRRPDPRDPRVQIRPDDGQRQLSR